MDMPARSNAFDQDFELLQIDGFGEIALHFDMLTSFIEMFQRHRRDKDHFGSHRRSQKILGDLDSVARTLQNPVAYQDIRPEVQAQRNRVRTCRSAFDAASKPLQIRHESGPGVAVVFHNEDFQHAA